MRASVAEQSVHTALSTEVVRASSVEVTIDNRVSQEEVRASVAEGVLNTALSNEIVLARSLESSIEVRYSNSMLAEITLARSAETRITTKLSNLYSFLFAEGSDLMAAPYDNDNFTPTR